MSGLTIFLLVYFFSSIINSYFTIREIDDVKEENERLKALLQSKEIDKNDNR